MDLYKFIWQKENDGIPIIRTGKKPSLYNDLIKANLNEDQLSLFPEECDGVCDV